MSALLFELSATPGLAEALCREVGCNRGKLVRRQFPDQETYVRFETSVARRDVILLCTLDRPDTKTLPLLFTAAAARAQGARSVGLVAPYLAYLRQDQAFQEGEAVTSRTFAELLSQQIDWLVTLDPHLHRYESLEAIYSLQALNVSSARAIGDWVRREVDQPVIIGPDEESRQWAEKIGEVANAQVTILSKHRSDDYSVSIDGTAVADIAIGTPVIIDDIASSARTMIETVELLRRNRRANPVCAVVHPIFAGDAYTRLLNAGPRRIVSTNSIPHSSNGIDISEALAEGVMRLV